jgi:hypothetical protein
MRNREAIRELRAVVLGEQGWRCFVCQKPLDFGTFQLAHRIPQRKWCIRRWGESVIHHRKNVVGVCSLYCNGLAQMDPESVEAREHALSIIKELCGEGKLTWFDFIEKKLDMRS